MRGKIILTTLLAGIISIFGMSNFASAADSTSLSVDVKLSEKAISLTFNEEVLVGGKSLSEISKDKVQLLQGLFNFESEAGLPNLSGDFAQFVNQDAIQVSQNGNSVSITLGDDLFKGVTKNGRRFGVFINTKNITDVNGDILGKSTGDIRIKWNKDKTDYIKSEMRFRLIVRTSYDDKLKPDYSNNEVFISAPASDKSDKEAHSKDIADEVAAIEAIKKAQVSKSESDIQAAKDLVSALKVKSSVTLFESVLAQINQPTTPIAPTTPTTPATQPAVEKPAEKVAETKKPAISAPNTGVKKVENGIFYLAISSVVMLGATYFAIKKA